MTARAGLALALVFTALSACNGVVSNVDQLVLHNSKPQTLVLQNGGDRPLLVQAQTGVGPPLPVAAGGSVSIKFEVLSVIQIAVPEGGTRFRVIDGTSRNIVEATNPSGYLRQTGGDAILRIGPAGAPADEHRLSLKNCPNGGWEKGPAPGHERTIDIARPPLPGVPSRICPKG